MIILLTFTKKNFIHSISDRFIFERNINEQTDTSYDQK